MDCKHRKKVKVYQNDHKVVTQCAACKQEHTTYFGRELKQAIQQQVKNGDWEVR